MVTSTTNTWTMQSIVKRGTPSVTSDFSFLKYGDDIKESTVVAGTTFEYRLEANQFGHWGGIWKAPRHYPLVSDYNFLTSVQLTTKFDNWEYSDAGIEQR